MYKILLDPGHGGSDPGACSNGLVEATLNLKVAKYAQSYLTNNYSDVEVKLTRDTDKSLSLSERASICRSYNPQVCWSVHHNSFSTESAQGVECFDSYYSDIDNNLSTFYVTHMTNLGFKSRGRKAQLSSSGSDYLYMIRNIKDTDTYAILSEGGFVSNSHDAGILSIEDNLRLQGEIIGESIAIFLNIPKVQVQYEENNIIIPNTESIPQWKLDNLNYLNEKGILDDLDGWASKIDGNMPVWAVCALLSKTVEYIENLNKNN